jgi:ketosteroid isomerase-like protein
MSEQENRDTIKRYFQAVEQRDLDAMANLMHDDYTEEYPQSGEKIRGKHNARSILENYPGGLPNMIDHSYVVSGDLGVMKMTLEYGGICLRGHRLPKRQDKEGEGIFWRALRGT